MTTARDIMHPGAQCVGEHDSLQRAAQLMRDLDVGALPICGDDNRLKGIVTDRDIVTQCIAQGFDPASTTAGQLAQGEPVIVLSNADVDDVLQAMESNKIRRVPVIENQELVGIISAADLSRHLPEQKVGEFVGVVSSSAG
jgi:CBS domain-containing protein